MLEDMQFDSHFFHARVYGFDDPSDSQKVAVAIVMASRRMIGQVQLSHMMHRKAMQPKHSNYE